jgi:hypothetical protein
MLLEEERIDKASAKRANRPAIALPADLRQLMGTRQEILDFEKGWNPPEGRRLAGPQGHGGLRKPRAFRERLPAEPAKDDARAE